MTVVYILRHAHGEEGGGGGGRKSCSVNMYGKSIKCERGGSQWPMVIQPLIE